MPADFEHRLLATLYDPVTWVAERTLFRPHREYLTADLDGRVLDLGAGTGAMFPYFADAIEGGANFKLHAIEPDPHMRRRAVKRAERLGLDVDVQSARAESLPYPDDSFDVVIASLVFCTIPGVEEALDEVARVLRPDGEFRFFEHVAADGWRGGFQQVLAPLWCRLAGGCHLTRRTTEAFVAVEEFEVLEIERLSTGVPPVAPFVRGRLRRRQSSWPRTDG